MATATIEIPARVQTMTPREAAEALGVSQRTALRLGEKGILKTVRLPGTRVRFRADSVREMIESSGLAVEATA